MNDPLLQNTMFDLFNLRHLSLRNRIVHSPHIEFQADEKGFPTAGMTDHYLTLAREGVGLIILESAYIVEQGKGHPNQLGLSKEAHTEKLAELVASIQACGTKVAIRLSHAGGKTAASICGEQPISPSSIGMGKEYDLARPFTEEETEEMVFFFVHAAERAEEAGADLVEINGGQQYLLDQCASAKHNKRTDEYGGTVEARMKMGLEIIRRVRQRLNPALPLSYMFSCYDRLDDSYGYNELEMIVDMLLSSSIDILHPISLYVLGKFFNTGGSMLEWLSKIATKPLIAEGNLKSPQVLKETLALTDNTLYALDKALFSRPNWYSFLEKKVSLEMAR